MSSDEKCRRSAGWSDIPNEAAQLRNYYTTAFRKRLVVWFSDPKLFPHDLHDDLTQRALLEHLEVLRQGKVPSKRIIVTRVWSEHWRKKRREGRSCIVSLDDPIAACDIDEEEATSYDFIGTSDLYRFLPLLLDGDALRLWEIIVKRTGGDWKSLGKELGCDWRTAKKRVQDVLFPELERVARLLGYGDGAEGVAALLHALSDSRYPVLFRRFRQQETEGVEDENPEGNSD